MNLLVVLIGLGTGAGRVVVGLGDQLVVLVLAGLGDFLRLGLALVDVLVVQLHGQRQHGGGALGLAAGSGGGTSDLLQAAGLRARLDLGDLLAQLVLALLGLLQLTSQIGGLRGLLLQRIEVLLGIVELLLVGGGLLLRFLQTSAHVPGADAVLVALVLHRGELRGDIGLAGGLGGLRGQLVDLAAEAIHLILELLVLLGQRAVALLGFGEFRRSHLSRLIVLAGDGRRGLELLVFALQ